MEYLYGEEQAFAHQAYMEDMIKRIQGGSRLEVPRKNIFHRSKKDMIGRVQEVKSSQNFFHENPIVFLLEENHVVVDKLRYWLPSMFYFLMYNEWCPQLAATKSLALKDSNFSIEWVKENELVAWFVLFLFTNISPEYKEYATLCLKRLVTTEMSTICQTNMPAEEHLLHCVLTLTLEDNSEVIRQACCAIAFLCGCHSVSLTFGYCVNNQLLELAKCKEHGYTLAWPALHALRYSAGDDAHMLKRIVKERRFLLELLRRKHGNDDKRIIEEACWTVDTIVRGYKDKFLEDGKGTSFIPLIVQQSYSGDFHIKRAAVVAISTATTCATKNQIRKLVRMGCLQVLCSDLDYFDDEWPLTCCLDGIENILKRGDLGRTGHMNFYAPAMDECHGWSALKKVVAQNICELAVARALEIEEKYYLSEDEIIWGWDAKWRDLLEYEEDSECSTDEEEEDQPPLKRR